MRSALLIVIMAVMVAGCLSSGSGSEEDFWEHVKKAEEYRAKSSALWGEIMNSSQGGNYEKAERLVEQRQEYNRKAKREAELARESIDNPKLQEFAQRMIQSSQYSLKSTQSLGKVVESARAGKEFKAGESISQAEEMRDKAEQEYLEAMKLEWLQER